ncbi:hypothetical protein [Pelagovum pacificum]|uniref:Uncharacterized protein n=1 Tax=Pelagovum pacificum TaxID=2588711 RepID=A0A5C5GFN9_9RHOB|nr:hypothetical protein [Pelagovum pacificum]QQA44510.1 hypothetical protein I8N54_08050 [Pelagovum pacificum]TNY32376.1 hypothetical protein FHY64_03530 [Pelagovum pacificum]
MNSCPIETTALLAQPLPRDANGNARYFIPERRMPVAPGSKLARKVGLRKYRGKDLGPGFVIQAHHLATALHEVFAALDHHAPEGAPHAFRSDGPLFFALRLPDEQYRYMTELFEALAPWLFEKTEAFSKIVIASDLPASKREAAVNMLMTFPVLRSAMVRQLSYRTAGQYYGLEVLIRNDGFATDELTDLTDPSRDHAAISSFLARREPPPR